MSPNRVRVYAMASVMMVSGAAVSVWAQDTSKDSPARTARATSAQDGALHYEFFKASTLVGMDVNNPRNEEIAKVQDFLIDRGSGQVEYALLHTGGVLGLGGKTVAVPYSQLGYDPVEKAFTLSMTAEQLKQSVEFIPDDWSTVEHSSWADELHDRLTADDAARKASRDRQNRIDSFASAEGKEISGTIMSVKRVRHVGADDQIVAVVKTSNGSMVDLQLGPAWYVMASSAAPMRGDSITAQTRVITGQGDARYYVTSATIDGNDINLRRDDSSPYWTGQNNRSTTASSSSGYVGRLVLISDVSGAKANALDKENGDVQDLIVERRSGRVAFIAFDPNDNFLGLGDTILMVPWPLVSVRSDASVFIDADKQMFASAPKMPADLNVYAAPSRLEPVYTTYGIEVDRFEPLPTSGPATSRR